jgi:hypothetical protein
MRSIHSLRGKGRRTIHNLRWEGNFQVSSSYPNYVGWYVIINTSPDNPALDWQNATNRTSVHFV